MQAIPVDYSVEKGGSMLPKAPIDTVVIPAGPYANAPSPPTRSPPSPKPKSPIKPN